MLFSLLIWAQDGGGGGGGQPPPNPMFMPLMLLGLFGLFYLLIIRPANRRMAEEKEAMLNNLDPNDVLLTIGGIYVTVISNNKDKQVDEILVKIEDGSRMKITRSAIAQNITKEKEKQKAREAAQQPAGAEVKK
jgi:preprotein translocase subunit YajC